MQFRVYLLRRNGRLLPWREVQNGPSFTGELVTYRLRVGKEDYNVAGLQPSPPKTDIELPKLFEPALIGFAIHAFRLRGFERVEGADGAIGVVQEWHCTEP